MRRLYVIALLCLTSLAQASPNVINGTTHAGFLIPVAVNAVLGPTGCGGSSCVSNPIFIDANPSDNYLPDLFAAATPPTNVCNIVSGQSNQNCGTLVANHGPYAVVSSSYCCLWTGQLVDVSDYSTSITNNFIHSIPLATYVAGPTPTGMFPPASSALSTEGPSDWGVEFSFAASADHSSGICTVNNGCWQLCSGDTCRVTIGPDSTVTAYMAGILASAKYKQPTWNWFDIKGALRQTAVVCNTPSSSQWAVGYDHTKYGYGCVQFDTAVALSGTSAIYLQTPTMQVVNHGYYVEVNLYPFRSTRRNHEVVYSCTAGHTWPVKNEYALSDITAGCSTLLYTSNGTDTIPSFVFAPLASGTVTLIAFTTDGSGNYSRVEQFSPVSATLTIGSMCPI